MILLIIPPEIQSIQQFRFFFTAELQKIPYMNLTHFSYHHKDKVCVSHYSSPAQVKGTRQHNQTGDPGTGAAWNLC